MCRHCCKPSKLTLRFFNAAIFAFISAILLDILDTVGYLGGKHTVLFSEKENENWKKKEL